MINQPCRDFHAVLDDLPRQSIFGDETCAQGFVARSEAVQRRFERGGIERSSRAKNGGHVVQGGVRLKLVEEPKPLLAEGQGPTAFVACLVRRLRLRQR